jgi:hypothetical protein
MKRLNSGLKDNMKRILLLASMLLLSACTTSPIVNVPIPVKCPTPHIPPKPHLMIESLSKNSTPDAVMKSYVASVYLLDGYSDSLLKILSGYS